MQTRWTLARETTDPVTRIVLGAVAPFPLFGFWDLVVRPWPAALSLFGLPLLFIGGVCLTLGLVLLATAIIAPNREVVVDEGQRAILELGDSRLTGPFHRRTPFDRITAVTLAENPDTDSLNRLHLCLHLTGRRNPRVLLRRPLSDRPQVEALATRLRAEVQG